MRFRPTRSTASVNLPKHYGITVLKGDAGSRLCTRIMHFSKDVCARVRPSTPIFHDFENPSCLTFIIAAFSAFSDGVLAIYPIFIIWNLQMAKRMKLGLGLVMALGILCVPHHSHIRSTSCFNATNHNNITVLWLQLL